MAIRAVLFDVGGTLLRVCPSVGGVYSETARQHGFDACADTLDENFRSAWRESLARRKERNFVCSDAILREEWYRIVCDTFGQSVPRERMPRLFDDLYDRFATATAWEVAPRARETLHFLRRQSIRLGVLSNWDSRLPTTLHELELAELFDFAIVSFDIGVEKPHPNIFRAALEAAGTPPGETLLVGDSYEADIVPARTMGLETLWVRSRGGSPEHDGPILEQFPEHPEPFWRRWIATGDTATGDTATA